MSSDFARLATPPHPSPIEGEGACDRLPNPSPLMGEGKVGVRPPPDSVTDAY